MPAPLIGWILDALDRGLDVGFRMTRGAAGGSAGGGTLARGEGVFVWGWRVTDLSGAEWRWIDAERAPGAPRLGASKRRTP